jgi:phage terminase large subunit-like protein
VRDKCRDLGVPFDEWQDGAGRLILAKRADGKLAAKVGGVGMSLPRQVGKTYLLGALIFALAILKPGLLIIWTAHHARTSSETFLSMQGFAKRRKIAPYIEVIYKGSGDEAVVFHNRSRILFGARERGFGRGIPGVDVLMCDEAQILTERALSNMLPTLNTSKLGLVVYVGTPPRPEDPSEAFVRMRDDALSGEAEDLVWIECGADPDASPDDREQWAKANPSFPHRTPEEAFLRLRRKLGEESFLREGLGIWEI